LNFELGVGVGVRFLYHSTCCILQLHLKGLAVSGSLLYDTTSQHVMLHLKRLFSSSLCTLYGNITARILCTSAVPERAVLQFSVYSAYSIWHPMQHLCTSAAPEKAVLQFCVLCVLNMPPHAITACAVYLQLLLKRLFSSSPVYSIWHPMQYHSTYMYCVPQLLLKRLFFSSLCTLRIL
jgi:hypothetical protein